MATRSVRLHLADYRASDLSETTKTLTIPVEANKALLSLGGWSVQFGRGDLDSAKFSRFTVDFGVESFQDDKLKLILRAGLRDRLGDNSWEGTFEILVMLFS